MFTNEKIKSKKTHGNLKAFLTSFRNWYADIVFFFFNLLYIS